MASLFRWNNLLVILLYFSYECAVILIYNLEECLIGYHYKGKYSIPI